jgi:hypothetical protein
MASTSTLDLGSVMDSIIAGEFQSQAARHKLDADAAMARHRDNSEHVGLNLTYAWSDQLINAVDPTLAMTSNLAARVPTTLEHPAYGGGLFPAPAPSGGAGGAVAGKV